MKAKRVILNALRLSLASFLFACTVRIEPIHPTKPAPRQHYHRHHARLPTPSPPPESKPPLHLEPVSPTPLLPPR
jgi:hypothetical protein